jgi:uncharacterized membrane protein
MIISRYFVWFLVYSFLGWCFETVYCTATQRQWANRGFLYGPICPIYGFGAIAISIIIDLLDFNHIPTLTAWQVFLISMVGSAIMEYLTSWALEKWFHAYWWDYSNLPFNLNGRICLPASLLFGCAGVFIVFKLYPFISSHTTSIPPLAMEGISLALMALFAADLALTLSALTRLDALMKDAEETINQHMEQFVSNLTEKQLGLSQRIAEEKQRFSRQNFERMTRSINPAHRRALSRIKGFRPNVQKHPREYWDTLLEILKKQKKNK